MKIYRLCPECMETVWGGTRLKKEYGKITDKEVCAESWELSYHKDGPTRLEDGSLLSEVLTEKELGTNTKSFSMFPTLIKFIDAEADLSVQVHPSDEYALEHHGSYGKTEMWYIVDACEGAGIYLGFKNDITKEEYEKAIAENTLVERLNFIKVKKGDCFFIPSGTLHAIGKGCLIYEIQQNSNITYRVYDYGRKDKNGKERELHVSDALKVSCLDAFKPTVFSGDILGTCPYFTAKKLEVNGESTLVADETSFNCITCVDGEGSLEGMPLKKGDSLLVPAGYGSYTVRGCLLAIVASV